MEILASGLHVPEGPSLDIDGSILFTEQTAGRISRYADGSVATVAVVGGAPNSCVVGLDGIYVCQNGGVVGSWRSADPRLAGIQRISGGKVHAVASTIGADRLIAPNDLVFDARGNLLFTDPAQPFNLADRAPRGAIYALGEHPGLVFATGGVYCNGIGLANDGSMLWVESYTRRLCRLDADGARDVVCQLPEGEVPDGFAVADDGRIFIASCGSNGISVVSATGEYLGLIRLDDNANPTNCCFDGSDLIVTDFGIDFETRSAAGRLWRVPVGVAGAPVHRGSVAG